MKRKLAKVVLLSVVAMALFLGCEDTWHPEDSSGGSPDDSYPLITLFVTGVTSRSVSLSWSSVSNVDHYSVNYTSDPDVSIGYSGYSTRETFITIPDLTENTTYYFVVTAYYLYSGNTYWISGRSSRIVARTLSQ